MLGGQLIKAGEGIIAATQSGNRDEDVFPDPDRFDMHRKRGEEQALGYGYGQHRCVAEGLARVELEVVFCEYFLSSFVLFQLSLTDWVSELVPETAESEVGGSKGGGQVLGTDGRCRNNRTSGRVVIQQYLQVAVALSTPIHSNRQ